MEQITGISSIGSLFGLLVHPIVILFLMGFSLMFFAFMSIIFLHHWKSYSVDKSKIQKVMRVYFFGGGILLVTILITGVMSL